MTLGSVFGMEMERRLMPLFGVSFLSAWGFSAFWGFVGVWALHYLKAPASAVGIMYGSDAALSAFLGILGGRLSDRVGRRPIIAASWALEAAASLGIAAAGHRMVLGLALVVVAGAASGPGLAASTALVADLTHPGNRDSQYAALRAAASLGGAAGPSLGGWVIGRGHWPLFFLLVGILGMVASGLSAWILPRPPVAHGKRATLAAPIRMLMKNRPFLLLLLSTLAGYWVFVGYDVVLPIASIGRYGLSPAAWGVLALILPAMIVAMQGRVTRWACAWPVGLTLAGGLMLMGVSFSVLLGNHSAAAIFLALVLFGLGEMVWVPTSQALGSRMANRSVQGAYMGALGAAGSGAWVLAPLGDLSLYAARGPGAVWLLAAVAGGVAAALGAAAAHGGRLVATD